MGAIFVRINFRSAFRAEPSVSLQGSHTATDQMKAASLHMLQQASRARLNERVRNSGAPRVEMAQGWELAENRGLLELINARAHNNLPIFPIVLGPSLLWIVTDPRETQALFESSNTELAKSDLFSKGFEDVLGTPSIILSSG